MFSKIHMTKLFAAAAATVCLFAVSNAKADTQTNSDQHSQTQAATSHLSVAHPQHAGSADHKIHLKRHKHHKKTHHYHHVSHKTQQQVPQHAQKPAAPHAQPHPSQHAHTHHTKHAHAHATPTLKPVHLAHIAPASVTHQTVVPKPAVTHQTVTPQPVVSHQTVVPKAAASHQTAPFQTQPQAYNLHPNKKIHIITIKPQAKAPAVTPVSRETPHLSQTFALTPVTRLEPVAIQRTPFQTLPANLLDIKKFDIAPAEPQKIATANATSVAPPAATAPVVDQKAKIKNPTTLTVPLRTSANDGSGPKNLHIVTLPSQQIAQESKGPSDTPRQGEPLTSDQVALLQNFVQPVTIDPATGATGATDVKKSDALVDQITGKPIVFYKKPAAAPISTANTKLPDPSCFVYYSQHWTTTTDSDGDHKHQSVTCNIPSTNYAMWNIDAASSLQTPQVGTNNPIPHQYISVDGKPTPSNQEDTGIAYISVGQTLGYQDASQVKWGIRGGEINGAALNVPRSIFKAIHNAEGEGSRESPASSKAQLLIGGTIAASYPIVDFTSAADAFIPSARMTINLLPSATIGTDERSAEIGISANIGLDGQLGPQHQQSDGTMPSNFSTGLSVELSGQYVNYNAVTNYAGTKEFQAQAKTALQYSLNDNIALQLTGMVRLNPEVNNPVRNLPNKFEVGAGIKFAF